MNGYTGRWVPPKLRAALAAASRGWLVFPVFPGSKHPAITRWQDRATNDPDAVALWWRHRPYNIAIACGPANLLVVDLDRPHRTEPDTEAVLALLDAEPSTYTVVTPRGQHRYFTVEPGGLVRSTAGRLAPGVDTRAAGGFVLAAGSARHVEGQHRRYRAKDPAAVLRPAPDWLLRAVAARGGARRVEADVLTASVAGQRGAYVRAAINRETARVRSAQPGGRNTALFTAAVHLGRLIGGGLLADRDATEVLAAASSRHIGVDGFTTWEADRAIANGLRYGQRPDTR